MRGRRWRRDDEDDESRVRPSRLLDRVLPPPFQIGERLLLREAVLRRFDVPCEFRALDGGVALVLCRDQFEIVPLVSLRGA